MQSASTIVDSGKKVQRFRRIALASSAFGVIAHIGICLCTFLANEVSNLVLENTRSSQCLRVIVSGGRSIKLSGDLSTDPSDHLAVILLPLPASAPILSLSVVPASSSVSSRADPGRRRLSMQMLSASVYVPLPQVSKEVRPRHGGELRTTEGDLVTVGEVASYASLFDIPSFNVQTLNKLSKLTLVLAAANGQSSHTYTANVNIGQCLSDHSAARRECAVSRRGPLNVSSSRAVGWAITTTLRG